MFEKMIGVSPPQVGKAQDSKVANVKDFREIAESKSLKNDFEKALKEKQQKADKKAEPERKPELAKKEESRADKKDKKSSGGIKKKMTEVDEKMVSNNMASFESVVEIPVPEEESAKIEIDNKIQDPALLQDDALQDALTSALSMKPLDEAVQGLKEADAAAMQESIQNLAGVDGDSQAEGKSMAAEAQLEASVDFKPSAEAKAANKDLLGKLKEFDAPAKPDAAANAFEKNVLEALQKEGSSNAGQFSQKDQESGLDQGDRKDLKSELIGNQLHQASGQSHASFKNQLEAAGGASTASKMDSASLESNREANINEIMSKAQYLVKAGGGEMNVKMSPDGMGEVQLRVILDNGKLNVEIQTQDKEVKKLIEESLSDLKSGLAAHRLSLEHVKIDTVNATNTDNNTQLHSNLDQSGSEDRARDFWSETQKQMNQQSQQRSSSSFESSRSAAPAVASSKVSQAQALRTYGGTKGASLNRVA